MKPHFKDNAFVGLAKNVPNPFCQGQRAYCAVDSSLVLFTGLDDYSLKKTRDTGMVRRKELRR